MYRYKSVFWFWRMHKNKLSQTISYVKCWQMNGLVGNVMQCKSPEQYNTKLKFSFPFSQASHSTNVKGLSWNVGINPYLKYKKRIGTKTGGLYSFCVSWRPRMIKNRYNYETNNFPTRGRGKIQQEESINSHSCVTFFNSWKVIYVHIKRHVRAL